MFEQIIQEKVNLETRKLYSLPDLSSESVRKSDLAGFIKNFLFLKSESLKDNNFIEKDEACELLENAIKLNLNYTLRPKWTILNFVFGAVESKPANEVQEILEIFEFYFFYQQLISNYITENALPIITKFKIRELIEETDNVLHSKLTSDISSIKIKNFFLQLFKLKYNDESFIGLESSIPYSFIRIFLSDKGYKDLHLKFSKINSIKYDWEFDLKTIIKIITDKYDENLQQRESNSHSAKEDAEVVPSYPGENKQDSYETINPEREKPEVIPEYKEYPTEEIETKPSIINKRVKNLFKESELEHIVKRVYKGNREEMLNSFIELSNIVNWFYASEYLKNLFVKNNVKLHDRYVVLFTDVLAEYYRKKSREQ